MQRGLQQHRIGHGAVAVFGDHKDRLRYTPLTAKTRFTALQSKEIDVLTRNCTQTLGRDTSLGLDFVQVNYYDGQGFMVPKALGLKSAKELGGATVCVLPGTTTEQNAADFFRSNNMEWKTVTIESTAELSQAFYAGRCDVMTSDASQLAGMLLLILALGCGFVAALAYLRGFCSDQRWPRGRRSRRSTANPSRSGGPT